MVIKSYKKGETEFIISMASNDVYRVIRLIKGQEPDLTPAMGYECANEVFDYFLDMNEERDLK